MKDALGDRMKDFYENRTKQFLPRRTHTIIRLDGKAFHTYTKRLIRPFDIGFIEDMNKTAQFLCKEIQGAKYAYVQSDEISILLTDYNRLTTDAWFNGNIQKITSVSASLATAKFNQLRVTRELDRKVWDKSNMYLIATQEKLAMFDSRVFTIPSDIEVMNYFIWRQQDAIRNSISSLAQSIFSHNELNGIKTDHMKSMCKDVGYNWDELASDIKYGRIIKKEKYKCNEAERTRWSTFNTSPFSEKINQLTWE